MIQRAPESDSGVLESDAGGNTAGGDGIVTEEQVQKGYVWMNEVNNNIFDTTYQELVEYFGVEGQFVKEEYSDHMKANYRYYKWISEEDDSHFIYVNFKEEENGVYEVSGYNTSGFSGKEAIAKYLDAVKAEAAEANKAASANAVMKDFSKKVSMFAHDEVSITIKTKIPESGWSYDDGNGVWWKMRILPRLVPEASGLRSEKRWRFRLLQEEFQKIIGYRRPRDRRNHLPGPYL